MKIFAAICKSQDEPSQSHSTANASASLIKNAWQELTSKRFKMFREWRTKRVRASLDGEHFNSESFWIFHSAKTFLMTSAPKSFSQLLREQISLRKITKFPIVRVETRKWLSAATEFSLTAKHIKNPLMPIWIYRVWNDCGETASFKSCNVSTSNWERFDHSNLNFCHGKCRIIASLDIEIVSHCHWSLHIEFE